MFDPKHRLWVLVRTLFWKNIKTFLSIFQILQLKQIFVYCMGKFSLCLYGAMSVCSTTVPHTAIWEGHNFVNVKILHNYKKTVARKQKHNFQFLVILSILWTVKFATDLSLKDKVNLI